MLFRIVDVLVMTRQKLSDQQFDVVAENMKTLEGIHEFKRLRHSNFIRVAYDANKVMALQIINKITRMGFNASLVGM